MIRTFEFCSKGMLAGSLALALFAPLHGAQAKNDKVLYSFTGGSDGSEPFAGMIADGAGNLYGTTSLGGADGHGTVFKIASDGTESVLHSFDGTDGNEPSAAPIMDGAGNLYGTTFVGGANGAGAVFKLTPGGTESVLYAFTGGTDGQFLQAGVIEDSAGNLYGTALLGGAYDHGDVYRLAPDGTLTVLYSFTGGNDGAEPEGSLVEDSSGNLYGTTSHGGADNDGTVFRLAADGTETVLHSFSGGSSDGSEPFAGLIIDSAGNLYGTTFQGGSHNMGTVFKVAADGAETMLYALQGGNDGASPEANLVEDGKGNLYGTASLGGGTGCGGSGCGTVFEITGRGSEKVLHRFAGAKDGAEPASGLVLNQQGLLYGTASFGGGAGCGGSGCGTVFRLKR
ncbi:MAG TPA: choice-of-anchor tandem repeat GloVer-containing protein [Rhizomicrobium sp.]|nr:choice-of-anchor tandem repeat GloVer-containing protein [Rhizomicrobium sp.]